jgi:branched-chain amino acid aminotransferase
MPSNVFAYVNGLVQSETEASVSIFDRGFLYGDGAFETLRVYHGKPYRLAEHLMRLYNGLQTLAIPFPFSPEECSRVVHDLIVHNEVANGVVRIHVTRGLSEPGTSPGNEPVPPGIVVTARPRIFPEQPTPMRVIIANTRILSTSPIVHIKSANRLPYTMARMEADRVGADEAIMLNEHNRVVEFTSGNLFLVSKFHLYTPPLADGTLPGITRQVVCELARQQGVMVHETGLTAERLYSADEIFSTNSVSEIVPVSQLGARTLPADEITLRLRQAYRASIPQ